MAWWARLRFALLWVYWFSLFLCVVSDVGLLVFNLFWKWFPRRLGKHYIRQGTQPHTPRAGAQKTSATALAPRVHRSIARGPASTSPTKRTATTKAIESTSKPRAPLRVVLVQASVVRQLLSRLSGEKRVAILSKNTSATALAPRVHHSIARGLVSTSSTKRTATAKAIESTSKPRAPLRVALVQANVPRRPLRVRNPKRSPVRKPVPLEGIARAR